MAIAISATAAIITTGKITLMVLGFHAVARDRPITAWWVATATSARPTVPPSSHPASRGAAPLASVNRATSARGRQLASAARAASASASPSGPASASAKPAVTTIRSAPSA